MELFTVEVLGKGPSILQTICSRETVSNHKTLYKTVFHS